MRNLSNFALKTLESVLNSENQNKLFELFGMIDETSNLNPNGCGIGLTVSKKFVEHLGGKIHLKSEYGKGKTIKN